jgi:hypothetical protein
VFTYLTGGCGGERERRGEEREREKEERKHFSALIQTTNHPVSLLIIM